MIARGGPAEEGLLEGLLALLRRPQRVLRAGDCLLLDLERRATGSQFFETAPERHSLFLAPLLLREIFLEPLSQALEPRRVLHECRESGADWQQPGSRQLHVGAPARQRPELRLLGATPELFEAP